jgi:hypothetical protein
LSTSQNQFPGILGLLSVSGESPWQKIRKKERISVRRLGEGQTMMRRMTDGDENPTKTVMSWERYFCGFFNDAFNIETIASDKMSGEWKGFGWKRTWPDGGTITEFVYRD